MLEQAILHHQWATLLRSAMTRFGWEPFSPPAFWPLALHGHWSGRCCEHRIHYASQANKETAVNARRHGGWAERDQQCKIKMLCFHRSARKSNTIPHLNHERIISVIHRLYSTHTASYLLRNVRNRFYSSCCSSSWRLLWTLNLRHCYAWAFAFSKKSNEPPCRNAAHAYSYRLSSKSLRTFWTSASLRYAVAASTLELKKSSWIWATCCSSAFVKCYCFT